MWKKLVGLSEDKSQVLAKLPSDLNVSNDFSSKGLEEALSEINASHFFVMEEEVTRFVNYAKDSKGEAYSGLAICEVRDAKVEVVLTDHDMLASMKVTGAYGGSALKGSEVVHALATAHVTKGINKLALKKVLLMSTKLKPGETFTQPVAKGKNPVQGQDAKFIPLVKDPTKQILAPKSQGEDKVDMLNLGETITVDVDQPLMKRVPATKGVAGITVQGKVIPPKPGNDQALSAAKGSHISPTNPNLLLATDSGMPLIKAKTVEVENALCVPQIGVATGHVKFKGNVVVLGDIESDMLVRATGTITVGGFIESADVQAQGDIEVAKGIIGHTSTDGNKKSCCVKSGGNIKANYAQYSEIQAAENIELAVHCMSNDIRCGNDLTVCDRSERQGTLSGGTTRVGGKVTCVNLGVEGDTATHVEGFARFGKYKERINKHKEHYKKAQEATMDIIRQELEFKKKPKSERTDEEEAQIDAKKVKANDYMEKAKNALEMLESEFEALLETNIVDVKGKVYTHVTVQFGEEKVVTKRTHGPSTFSFNQYEIQYSSKLDEEDVGVDI